jgi:transposase
MNDPLSNYGYWQTPRRAKQRLRRKVLAQAVKSGMDVADVADRHDVSITTVRRAMAEHGVRPRGRRRR